MANESIRSTAKSFRDVIAHYVMGMKDKDGNFLDPVKALVDLEAKVTSLEEMVNILSKDAVAEATDQGTLDAAFSNADVAVVNVASGTFTPPAEAIAKPILIKGANAGVSAATGDRCTDVTPEGETVITGAMTFAEGATAVLDGVTITPDTFVSLAGSSDVTLRNVRVVDCTPDAAKSFIIKGTSFDNKVKLNLSGCYFGNNESNELGNIYNGFELNATLLDGSIIENCYFAKDCVTHNVINIYAVDEGATITIRNNHFEKSANAIRIGVIGEPTCTIVMTGNSYDETDADPNWAGLCIIQPYTTKTTSFKNMTVIVEDTVRPDKGQLIYMFANPTDTQLTEETVPTIIVDGVVQKDVPIVS